MKDQLLVIVLLLLAKGVNTQTTWSLEQVLQIAMEQNQDIEIAKQRTVMEGQRVFKSNAGLTPTVNSFISGDYSQNNVALELNALEASGPTTQEISADLAGSMTHQAGVRIDYTLFDGGRGKGLFKQLQNAADLTALQQQLTTDNTLLQVSQLYLTITNMERTQDLLYQNIELSQQRLKRAELNDKYAKGNGLSVLRAKTDLNTDLVSLKNLQRDLENIKEDLLHLLNINDEVSFSTTPFSMLKKLPDFAALKTSALQSNPQILLANQGVVIEKQQLVIDQAANRPQVSIYGMNSFMRQDYEVNQIRYSQSIGPSAGFSINYNVFDGKKRQKNQDIQQLQIKISEQEQALAVEQVLLELEKSWNTHQKIKEQLDFEQQNLPFYEASLRRSQTDYEAGKATDTDIRTAQLGLLSAQISIVGKEIELQMEHFKLLKTAGLITTL